MIRSQPMLAVADVESASLWFQRVLGLSSGHGGDEYEMLMDDGEIVLQLHAWAAAHEHDHLGSPNDASRGNGVLIWLHTSDFDGIVERVRAEQADIIEGPMDNPNSHLREIWLRTPDGYTVVVAGG